MDEDTVIMGIDPSSTATGWALGSPIGFGAVVKYADVIKPSARWSAIKRVEKIVEEMSLILEEYMPNIVVIELPGPKVHRRVKSSNPHGLAVYGMASGAVWGMCLFHPTLEDSKIIIATPNKWTEGSSKNHRKRRALGVYPGYKPSLDQDGDMADAICLCDWHGRQDALGKTEKA